MAEAIGTTGDIRTIGMAEAIGTTGDIRTTGVMMVNVTDTVITGNAAKAAPRFSTNWAARLAGGQGIRNAFP